MLKPGRYIRLKRDTRLPNAREEFELLKKFANYTFSSGLNETATIDDLNYEYMKEYLIATHAKQDIRALSKLEMARSMGLISESEYGGYRAKNFAVLMFADKPQEFIPYARVEIIREVIGTEKMESKILMVLYGFRQGKYFSILWIILCLPTQFEIMGKLGIELYTIGLRRCLQKWQQIVSYIKNMNHQIILEFMCIMTIFLLLITTDPFRR